MTHRADVLWRAIHPGRGLADCFPRSHQDHGTKEQTDRTTLDLFAHERRPGRPKTNPLSRDEQLRINKRNQLKRDKVRGLKRVELKLNAEAVEALNELAESRNMSRSELIEEMLMQQLAALRSQGIV
ncbi:LexA regulated protein [Escherichia coli]|nr:LexA regulated protein [Escherichia coli]